MVRVHDAVDFHVEPNLFSTFEISVESTAGSDSSKIVSETQIIAGFVGAKYFGVHQRGGGKISTVTIRETDNANSFEFPIGIVRIAQKRPCRGGVCKKFRSIGLV